MGVRLGNDVGVVQVYDVVKQGEGKEKKKERLTFLTKDWGPHKNI